MFGIGEKAEEGHTVVCEEQQRDGWNEEEEEEDIEKKMRGRLEQRMWLTDELDIGETGVDDGGDDDGGKKGNNN